MKATLKGTVSDMGKENPIILVVNVGSTSLKYRLFDMRGQTCLAKGAFDRVGTARSAFSWEQKGMHGSGEINTQEGYSPCIGKMMHSCLVYPVVLTLAMLKWSIHHGRRCSGHRFRR